MRPITLDIKTPGAVFIRRLAVTDCQRLTNSELQNLLYVTKPEMSSFAVTNETRQTAIAILEFLSADAGQNRPV